MSASKGLPGVFFLRFFYTVFLGSLGISVTFLPLALEDRGLSLSSVSLIFLFPLLIRLVAPTLWGFVADRFHLTALLLRIACWGAFLAYLPVLSGGPVLTTVSLVLYSFFRTPIGVLADALTFQRVAQSGGSYGGIRAFGTLGYASMTLLAGYLSRHLPLDTLVTGGSVLLFITALCSHGVKRLEAPRPSPILPALKTLLQQRGIFALLLATTLHAAGQTTYDTFFPIHFRQAGASSVLIGLTITLGAAAEIGVMAKSRALLRRMGTSRLLFLCSAVAVLRWGVTAVSGSLWVLIVVQVLHGLTFGAWYVAAATHLELSATPQVRASVQGILAVTSFGLGGVLAMALGATVGPVWGTAGQFGASALLALCAAGLMVSVPSARDRREAATDSSL